MGRGDEIVYQGTFASLKEVRVITQGFDCGIQFHGWSAFKAGDEVEAYELVQM